MAAGDTLIFSGLRWPAARIVGTQEFVFRREADKEPVTVLGGETFFRVETSGQGRAWVTDRPQGFWRSFSEIDCSDRDQVLAFIRRFGDPLGQLSPSRPVDTSGWRTLANILARAARAWTPESTANGWSRRTADPERIAEAAGFLELHKEFFRELHVVSALNGAPGLAFQAGRLDAFMVASAASALQRGVSLRRCDHCRSWFEVSRSDQRFCSGSCRALHTAAKRKDK